MLLLVLGVGRWLVVSGVSGGSFGGLGYRTCPWSTHVHVACILEVCFTSFFVHTCWQFLGLTAIEHSNGGRIHQRLRAVGEGRRSVRQCVEFCDVELDRMYVKVAGASDNASRSPYLVVTF